MWQINRKLHGYKDFLARGSQATFKRLQVYRERKPLCCLMYLDTGTWHSIGRVCQSKSFLFFFRVWLLLYNNVCVENNYLWGNTYWSSSASVFDRFIFYHADHVAKNTIQEVNVNGFYLRLFSITLKTFAFITQIYQNVKHCRVHIAIPTWWGNHWMKESNGW